MNYASFFYLYGLMNIVFSVGKDICSLFYLSHLYFVCFVVIFCKSFKTESYPCVQTCVMVISKGFFFTSKRDSS